jgi:hypothetical protein
MHHSTTHDCSLRHLTTTQTQNCTNFKKEKYILDNYKKRVSNFKLLPPRHRAGTLLVSIIIIRPSTCPNIHNHRPQRRNHFPCPKLLIIMLIIKRDYTFTQLVIVEHDSELDSASKSEPNVNTSRNHVKWCRIRVIQVATDSSRRTLPETTLAATGIRRRKAGKRPENWDTTLFRSEQQKPHLQTSKSKIQRWKASFMCLEAPVKILARLNGQISRDRPIFGVVF